MSVSSLSHINLRRRESGARSGRMNLKYLTLVVQPVGRPRVPNPTVGDPAR
jgi:hypothetical protein